MYVFVYDRAWILFYQYHLTIEKSTMNMSFAFDNDVKNQRTWFIDHIRYVGDEFLFRIFLIKSLIEVVGLLWAVTFITFPEVATEVIVPDESFCPSAGLNTYTILVILIYDAILIMYAAVKLGMFSSEISVALHAVCMLVLFCVHMSR